MALYRNDDVLDPSIDPSEQRTIPRRDRLDLHADAKGSARLLGSITAKIAEKPDPPNSAAQNRRIAAIRQKRMRQNSVIERVCLPAGTVPPKEMIILVALGL